MLPILLKTFPFFALIGLGFLAGRWRVMPAEASAALTKFVFYFALSAMLFKLGSTVSLAELIDLRFVAAYLSGCALVYLLVFAVARLRRMPLATAAIEAQCAVIGNTGFLGVPMLVLLLGPAAAPAVLLVLVLDMVVFGALITLIVTAAKGGRLGPQMLGHLGLGLLKNPMIVSMVLGLVWGSAGVALPAPLESFLTLLGAAATPCALFAIGASLSERRPERLGIALWLSAAKLVLHPLAVALFAFQVFQVDAFAAAVMVATAALPVAGNTYILAAHFGVAPQRVSASILVSTAVSILTVSAVIAWASGF